MTPALDDITASAHDLLDEGRAEEALAALERALTSAPAAPLAVAEAHGLAGVAARALGRSASAYAHFDAAHAIFARSESPDALRAHASLLEDRAELELETSALDAARASLRAAIALRERVGDVVPVETLLALAEASLRGAALADAMEAVDRAIERALEEADESGAALALEMRGDALVALGEEEALFTADAAYIEAGERWTALGDGPSLARCLLGRARIAERRDDALVVHVLAQQVVSLEGLAASDRSDALDELRSLLVSLDRDDLASDF